MPFDCSSSCPLLLYYFWTTIHDSAYVFISSLQRRNAVAIQAWLWKDNKIPYIIDKSSFSMYYF